MTPDTLTILRIDPSVRVAELVRAFESIGLVLTSSEQGLRVMTKTAREISNLRKQR